MVNYLQQHSLSHVQVLSPSTCTQKYVHGSVVWPRALTLVLVVGAPSGLGATPSSPASFQAQQGGGTERGSKPHLEAACDGHSHTMLLGMRGRKKDAAQLMNVRNNKRYLVIHPRVKVSTSLVLEVKDFTKARCFHSLLKGFVGISATQKHISHIQNLTVLR